MSEIKCNIKDPKFLMLFCDEIPGPRLILKDKDNVIIGKGPIDDIRVAEAIIKIGGKKVKFSDINSINNE